MFTAIADPPRLDSFEPPPFPVRRWTVAEYRHLAEVGVLTPEDRVELIEGWIVPKMSHNPPHAWVLSQLELLLPPFLGTRWFLRGQRPLEAGGSVPEPDVAVVRMPRNQYVRRHPTGPDTALVIEVSDASVRLDRKKARIYAAAGIPVYWIINLNERQVEVHSAPIAVKRRYQDRRILLPTDRLSLQIEGQPAAELNVDDLLPPDEDSEAASV